jgi:hypothetical protein
MARQSEQHHGIHSTRLCPSPARVAVVLAPLLALSPCLAAVEGGDSGRSYYLELGAGGQYDSNVAVDELDLSSNESDYAVLLEAGLGLTQTFSEAAELDLWYDFSQSKYDEFSEVDQQSHFFGADLSVDVGPADLGLTGFHIRSSLDGDDFLALSRISPYVSGFIAKGWFARGAYLYSDKEIDISPGRDAEAHIGEADLYYFRDGTRSYFSIGYKYRNEDAVAARFDYSGHSVKLRYVQRFDWLGINQRLELSWRYLNRDYSSVTPSIGEKREDRRQTARMELKLPLNERATVEMYYAYSDYDSNLPSVDFHQHLAGARFNYRWDW